jgi:hypothetical protein
MRVLDRQILGQFVIRAAILDVPPEEFYAFMDQQREALRRNSDEHPKTLDKAGAEPRWM